MSIAEFSEIIKSKAYKSWFDRIQDSILKESASTLRGSQETASKTSFYITEKTIKDVASKLINGEVDQQTIDKIYANLKGYLGGRRAKEVSEPYTDGKALYFPRVSFDTINRILDAGFKGIGSGKISDFYQKGHVFGIATKTLEQTMEKLEGSTSLSIKEKGALLAVLGEIHKNLEEEDISTSNYASLEYKLYTKYRKNRKRYLVELQEKEVNQSSGRAVAPITNALRRYLDPGKIPLSTKLGIKFREEDEFFKKIIESKGSPSYIDLILNSIVEGYEGRPISNTEYSIPLTQVFSKKVKVNSSKVNNAIKQQKAKIRQLINETKKLKTEEAQKRVASSTLNLNKLMALINGNLYEAIKRNMGKGERRDVLNFRTGRFARSAEVTRLTMSREGMITAFYNYMKNPYATFSDGGRQQYPRSRDPKLLISKSIREIAAKEVANRLRAVVV